MSLTELKNKKTRTNNLERLTKEIEKINSGSEGSTEDIRFWKLERDKSGNGSAVIRFLPAPKCDGDETLPWVRYWDHGFKGPGGWYIENSLTTLGKSDPVSEYNSKLWNSTTDNDSPERNQARQQKRRLHYISNILVVQDPKYPENEGKVFLYRYGKKIFDKITLAMQPEFDDEKPVDPFDMWEGANLKLRIRTVNGFPNYDQSVWETPEPISDDDAKLEEIYNSEYSLLEHIAPDKFKSYEDLKTKLNRILGGEGETNSSHNTTSELEKIWKNSKKEVDGDVEVVNDEDDDLAEFRKLAEA